MNAKHDAATEYRNAKAALEVLLGVTFRNLEGALRASRENMADFERDACSAIKLLYKSIGANVEADAAKTIAYARVRDAFLALPEPQVLAAW